MEYVVTKERLKQYLYSLGFNYRTVPDKTGRQEKVWLFKKTDLLMDSITYYTGVKHKMLENQRL